MYVQRLWWTRSVERVTRPQIPFTHAAPKAEFVRESDLIYLFYALHMAAGYMVEKEDFAYFRFTWEQVNSRCLCRCLCLCLDLCLNLCLCLCARNALWLAWSLNFG